MSCAFGDGGCHARALAEPSDTTNASALMRVMVAPLALLAPGSAAARLFDAKFAK
jgi:hypothetical protein